MTLLPSAYASVMMRHARVNHQRVECVSLLDAAARKHFSPHTHIKVCVCVCAVYESSLNKIQRPETRERRNYNNKRRITEGERL